jgi:hypothetical protein
VTSRIEEICSGLSNPPLSLEKVNRYRQIEGLPPLAELPYVEPREKVIHIRAQAAKNTGARPRIIQQVRAEAKPCTTCGGGVIQKLATRAASLAAAAVDFVKDGMHVASDEQQQSRLTICEACPVFKDGWCDASKGGCGCDLGLKVMARAAYCPQGKWFAHTDNYRPLKDPTRSLIFHIYPKLGAEFNWHWHLEQIRKHQDKFSGKIVIAVGVDPKTATIDEVQRLAEGIRVTKWIRADNTKALAETHTHVAMMAEVQSDDPNAIVFRYHTKGVTKTPDAVEQRWAELLWQVNMDLPSVEDALASHMTCGAMRSLTPLVSKKPGDFFFAGSAYWFRAADAFARNWTHTEQNRWWVEYVPCHLFNRHESASLLYDQTESSVIRNDHFATYIQPEWDQWRAARGL